MARQHLIYNSYYMKHLNKIVTITMVTGSLALAGLGIARANAADTIPSTDAGSVVAPFGHGRNHQQHLADRATEFKMTVTDLQKEIDAGKPMYQIAAEHGVTYSSDQQQRLTDLKTRLDDMVKVKYMTQSEADAAYQAAQANPMLGMGKGLHGHGRM